MKLLALVSLTMVAFAANSVLNRMALASGGMDAVAFATIRLVSGAVILAGLCLWQRGQLKLSGRRRATGVFALLLYLFGFSFAYLSLETGLGALILFGMVQITMFAGGLLAGEKMPQHRWLGAVLALSGLGWLLWPSGTMQVSLLHGLSMALAGMGWGIYSLIGRKAADPVQETGANFILAALIAGVPGAFLGEIAAGQAGLFAVGLAVISGAVASALGYALWYAVLPRLQASVAAVAQLTVPVIAMLGGLVFLGEALTLHVVLASGLVLGGVALSVGLYSFTSTSRGS